MECYGDTFSGGQHGAGNNTVAAQQGAMQRGASVANQLGLSTSGGAAPDTSGMEGSPAPLDTGPGAVSDQQLNALANYYGTDPQDVYSDYSDYLSDLEDGSAPTASDLGGIAVPSGASMGAAPSD